MKRGLNASCRTWPAAPQATQVLLCRCRSVHADATRANAPPPPHPRFHRQPPSKECVNGHALFTHPWIMGKPSFPRPDMGKREVGAVVRCSQVHGCMASMGAIGTGFFASRQMFCAQPPTAWKLLSSGGHLTSQPLVVCIHFQISGIYTHESDDAICACALGTDLYCSQRGSAAGLLGDVLRIDMSVCIGL